MLAFLHGSFLYLPQQKLEMEQTLTAKTYRARPPPAVLHKTVPIKLNTAAIMREELFFRKHVEDESKRLARLENGDFDQESFRIEQLVRCRGS